MPEEKIFNRREHIENSSYVCGVVEGFYGRPWTLDQRKHLFGRLKTLGLLTYLYAPKDDIKHRSLWREMYTEEEIDILHDMIVSAKNNKVNFVYAISPGIDIMYSNPEELVILKKKLEQVASIGCKSFAVLFDDIETEMQHEDQKHFKSFSDAHVYITNEVFDHLKPSSFFFCPTEYCEARAVPTLDKSEYLQTIGENLREPIHVLWTGPRVISRYLTVDHLKQVAKVLHRKPTIWDNLHANDYDQKRVFMGPLTGRSVEIKQYTSGFLTNPNCKYEANFIPLYSLSDWNASDRDLQTDESVMYRDTESPTLNIDLNGKTVYDPASSCSNAVVSWYDHFTAPTGPNIPQIPQIDTTADEILELITEKKPDTETSSTETQSLQLESIIQTVVTPEIVVPVELNSLTADYAQPMEEDDVSPADVDQADIPMKSFDDEESSEKHADRTLHISQIGVLSDMFYLPFEDGPRVQKLLQDYTWLMQNASVMKKHYQEIETLDPLQSEWLVKYDIVCDFLTKIMDAFDFIQVATNKTLVSELIPYAWEAHGIATVLLAVARWMMQGHCQDVEGNRIPEDVNSIEETWIHQTGFLTNSIRLLSLTDNVEKLFNPRLVLPLAIYTYDIRPFTIDDDSYISGMTLIQQTENQGVLRLRSKIFSDRNIRPCLLGGGEYHLLCEEVDASGRRPVCYASSHSNGRAYAQFLKTYKTEIKDQYKSTGSVDGYDLCDIVNQVDNWYPELPDDIFDIFPALVEVHFSLDAYDAVPMKRILQSIAVSLSMNGVRGYFLTVPVEQEDKQNFFMKIGLHKIGTTPCNKNMIFGHPLCGPPFIEPLPTFS